MKLVWIPRAYIILVACIVCFLFSILVLILLKNAGQWLYVHNAPPGRIDVICTFARNKDREEYSFELAKRYKNAVWIVNTRDVRVFINEVVAKGIDSSRLIVTNDCHSTFSEVVFFKNQIKERQFDRIVNVGLVSDPLHMRRIIMLVIFLMGGTHNRVHALPVPLERTRYTMASYRIWWKDTYLRKVVKSELFKIPGDALSTVPFFRNIRCIFEEDARVKG